MSKKERAAGRPRAESTDLRASRRFDMPYSAIEPRLINPALGLHNLVARGGHNAGYSIEVTVLDTPDHRLLRSGVVLAHRVLDERGEWYLGAPGWQPALPAEHVEPMGQGDLPEGLADLVRPFRRRTPLGPVAALACARREFALRDDHKGTVALLRDDKVTVRRGGLTTARYREVTFTPVGDGLTAEQLGWLQQALSATGATAQERFPSLASRLGAPATGPTDFPAPRQPEPDAPVEAFVTGLFTQRLRELVEADLALRSSQPDAGVRFRQAVEDLHDDLRGIATALDPDWVEDLEEELEWLTGSGEPALLPDAHGRDDEDELRRRLRGERYLALLDRLVTAARTPRLRSGDEASARQSVLGLIDEAVARLDRNGRRLIAEDDLEAWTEAVAAATQLRYVVRTSAVVLGRRAVKLSKQARQAAKLVRLAGMHLHHAEQSRQVTADLTPEQAFDAGVAYADQLFQHRQARRQFLAEWPAVMRKLHP